MKFQIKVTLNDGNFVESEVEEAETDQIAEAADELAKLLKGPPADGGYLQLEVEGEYIVMPLRSVSYIHIKKVP
jgi:hypothetical protein